MNRAVFRQRDFESLVQLGDSLKKEELDKTGRYGVGFNAVYHMTDMPMFISGDQFVVLDPHERIKASSKQGGIRCDFVKRDFYGKYPSQFAPFNTLVKEFDRPFDGTVFRYPLRTKKGAESSRISTKPYLVEDVMEMFDRFQNEAAECLLFMKYLEKISFYERGVDDDEPRLLYEIELSNGEKIRESRQRLAKNVSEIMASLDKSKSSPGISQSLSSNYIAEIRCFSHKSDGEDCSRWLIQNHLADVSKADQEFIKNHSTRLKDHKLIPWVGVAARLSKATQHKGRLFCFLPLPVSTPFNVHIHGFFSMSSSRRELPVPDQDDPSHSYQRAIKDQMVIKGDWNQYLFQHCIPQAWADLLKALTTCELDDSLSSLLDDYTFWPMGGEPNPNSKNVDMLWRNILEDVTSVIGNSTPVFRGVVSDWSLQLNTVVGKWTSLTQGFIEDDLCKSDPSVTTALARSGQLMIAKLPSPIEQAIISRKISHKRVSPPTVRDFLKKSLKRWPTGLQSDDKNLLLKYVVSDKKFQDVRGLPLIQLANGKYVSLDAPSAKPIYLATSEEHDLFKKWAHRLLNRNSPMGAFRVDSMAKVVNVQRWSFQVGVDYLTEMFSPLTMRYIFSDTIPWPDTTYEINQDWLRRLWEWIGRQKNANLDLLGALWLIPTNRETLCKVRSIKPVLWHDPSKSSASPSKTIVPLLEKLGCTFILEGFLPDKGLSSLCDIIINCSNAEAVLSGVSFRGELTDNEVQQLREYFSTYIRLHSDTLSSTSLGALKSLPIFLERKNNTSHNTAILQSGCYAVDCTKFEGFVLCAANSCIIDVRAPDAKYLAVEIAGLKYLNTIDYLSQHIIPNLSSLTSQPITMNALIERVLEYLPQMAKDPKVIRHLCNIPFVTVGPISGNPCGKTLSPVDVVDKDSALKDLFLSKEHVFPSGRFATPSNVNLLRILGLNSTLNCGMISNRIVYYDESLAKAESQSQTQEIYQKAMKFLRMLDLFYSNVRVTSKPDDFRTMNRTLIGWKWIPTTDANGSRTLSTAAESRGKDQRYLVSKVMATVDYKVESSELRKALGWDQKPPIEIVVKQLLALTKRHTLAHTFPLDDLEKLFKYLSELVEKRESSDIAYLKKALQNEAWIPIGTELYNPGQMTLSTPSNMDLRPYLMTIPPVFGKYRSLFKCFGIPEELRASEIVKIIGDIKAKKQDEPLNRIELKQAIDLLGEIGQIETNKGLYAPASDNTLVNVATLTFDDISKGSTEQFLSSASSENYIWCHNMVSKDLAEKLGIPLLSQTLIFESGSETDSFIPFEQVESLTARIKNQLGEYSDGALFVEFLQNADDAKAARFCLVLDPNDNMGNCKTLFSNEMKEWQGPALWIYNDSKFTDKDFKGLSQLGTGGKADVDGSIGKFGYGFLVAYHYTDLPSMVSGNDIIFFDPHRKYLPKLQGPNAQRVAGIRRNFVNNKLTSQFEDQFQPYKRLFNLFGFETNKPFEGTLFRLPLRNKLQAKRSDLSSKLYSVQDVQELLRKFKDEAFQGALLFLKHVENIEAFELKGNGSSEKLWGIGAEDVTEVDRTHRSMPERKQECTATFRLNLRISESKKNDALCTWLVTTGFSKPILDGSLQEFVQQRRLFAHTGVAGLLEVRDNNGTALVADTRSAVDNLIQYIQAFRNIPVINLSRGSLFSFLPLSISTGLPVHLHGCFDLTSDRRSIVSQTSGSNDALLPVSVRWNRLLLDTFLPQLHLEFLEKLPTLGRSPHLNNDAFVEQYFKFWPLEVNNTLLNTYCDDLMKLALSGDKKVFYTRGGGGGSGKWIGYKQAVFEDYGMFNSNLLAHGIINKLLVDRGVNVVQLPEKLLKKLTECKDASEIQFISPGLVCDKIRHTSDFTESMKKEELISLFEYLLQDNDFTKLRGCTILPLVDGTVGTLIDCAYYFGSKLEIDLFPNRSSSFVDEGRVSPKIVEKLRSTEAQVLGVKQLDDKVFVQMLGEVLRSGNYLDYDCDNTRETRASLIGTRATAIPNDRWLSKLWEYLEQKKIDMKAFENMPILPIIGSKGRLVSLNPKLPRIFDNGLRSGPIIDILIKTGTNIIDDKYSRIFSGHVLKFSATNVLRCLEMASSEKLITVEDLVSELTPDELEALKDFLTGNRYDLFGSTGEGSPEILNIFRELPIWRVRSSSSNAQFKRALDCHLLPRGLPEFSASSTKIAVILDQEVDRELLSKIGAKSLTIDVYLQINIFPFLENPLPMDKVSEFEKLLRWLLKENPMTPSLCKLLKQKKIVLSNGSFNTLFQAQELYDDRNQLFQAVFSGTGKFVATSLRDCLPTLCSIGLKTDVDPTNFMACVNEVVRLSNLGSVERPLDYLDRAWMVTNYFNNNFGTPLALDAHQIEVLKQLKFVPVGRSAINRLPPFARKFLPSFQPLSSLSQLCSPQYLDIVWTQQQVYDERFSPSIHVKQHVSSLREPSVEIVLEHLNVLARQVSQHCFGESTAFKKMLNKTYEYLQARSETPGARELIRRGLLLKTPPLFLNGEDPTELDNWKPASHLIIGIQEAINSKMLPVHENLVAFKKLLELGGADNVTSPTYRVHVDNTSPAAAVFKKFEEFYRDPAVNGYKDVVFIVGKEKERFPAVRIFLAMTSAYFCTMFLGGMSESRHENLPVEIRIDDISPTAFRIMLDYLHTGRIEVQSEDTTDQDFGELQVYLDLLEPATRYCLDHLKQLIEVNIAEKDMITVSNVRQIEEYAEKYDAKQLTKCCNEYKERNERVIVKAESMALDDDDS
ncbi:hypothetical protein BC937DRAFT_90449 [Endogone sp. FLAS-F59071]|nr:hypothetical protein BC937DRAFT_90449 [Endogone sp. FLAS-F59071]|eukprot:RUS22084.1 hypothetical protein BC937DRAFT_90449 [Endogone sp. FLAS-F59071]